MLAEHSLLGKDAAFAFTATGLILAPAAALLPFVSVDKLGSQHTGRLLSSVSALWEEGMRLLAIWVLVCVALAPVLLLGTLAGLLFRAHRGECSLGNSALLRAAYAIEHWAMPEVHVLAVLIALTKLSDLVNVTVGPGFWCYAAMSFFGLLAWRNFDLGMFASKPTEPALGGKETA